MNSTASAHRVLLIALCLFADIVAFAAVPASLTAEQITGFAIPRMTTSPKIDGTIDPTEWREALAVSGIVDWSVNVLIPRPTTYYLAWDSGHLYLACRTYLRPGYKPAIKDGRSDGNAYCFDDGLELLFKPMGTNVSAMNHRTEFRLFLNCLGNVGDLTRLAVGQQIKNWGPHFQTAARITAPGTAPNGGSWWELEVSATPEDFELTGPHHAGDQWKFMLGFNHIPGWMQARIPCIDGYYTADGKCVGTLVDNTPAVQCTMDSLANLASDGTAALNIRAYNPTKQETKLNLDIDIAGKITRHEILTIPAGGETNYPLHEKLPEEVKNGLASLRVTQGERTLLTYTALFKVGAYNWMLDPVKSADPTQFAFETQFNPVRNQLLVKADTYYLPDPKLAQALSYTVKQEGSGKVLAAGTITHAAEWYIQDILTLPAPAPGKYTVEGLLHLTDGKTLGPMTGVIEKKDEAKAFPEWWGKKYGNTERVLPPFTAITRKEHRWGCWGREYTLNALGLPDALTSQQAAVLAAPARIVAVVNGKETTIKLGAPTITEVKAWRIRFTGKATGAGLDFSAYGWLEQDGLVYVDLTYQPSGKSPVQVEALRIEYPLVDEMAESLVCIGPGDNFASKTTMILPKRVGEASSTPTKLWSTLDTGLTGSNMKRGSFYPTVWIGSEQRGFLWWGDHDRGWFPDNAVPAHEAIRVGNAVVLRNNIIGKPVELREARTISFSYLASPFKPLPAGWRMFATEDGTFGPPFRGVRKDSKTGEKVKQGHGLANWINPESRYPEEWSALWAEQKAQADNAVKRTLPFDPWQARSGMGYQHMSFQLLGYGHKSIEDDVFKYFGDEWYTSHPGDTWNDSYTDYAMYLFDRAFREGGVRSSYWDLSFPNLCGSLLSGLCYRLPDDRVQPGYNGWNIRRFFMRLWALQQDYGLNPGAVGCHSTNAYVLVSLPWIDTVLDGERDWNLDTSDQDWVDYYPVERMRAMSSPHNWGIGICWMSNYAAADKKKIIAAKTSQAEYLWMHDSWRNPYLEPAVNMTIMPPGILDWGLNRADTRYYPYWRNPYVSSADKDVLISLWQLPDRVLVGVFNYNRKQQKDITLKIDLDALQLTPKLPWQEFVGVRDLYKAETDPAAQLNYYARTLTIKALRPHAGRFIGIRKY